MLVLVVTLTVTPLLAPPVEVTVEATDCLPVTEDRWRSLASLQNLTSHLTRDTVCEQHGTEGRDCQIVMIRRQ